MSICIFEELLLDLQLSEGIHYVAVNRTENKQVI